MQEVKPKISYGRITAFVKADKDFYYFYFAQYGKSPREVCRAFLFNQKACIPSA